MDTTCYTTFITMTHYLQMKRKFQEKLPNRILVCLGVVLMSLCTDLVAHGGVMIEEDLCIIKFGFYKAHFTIYQPLTREDEEFCEDLPDSGPTIFVMTYLHNSLKQVPVDFRVIRDVTGLGRFAKWNDLEQMGSLEDYSVYYLPPALHPNGVLKVKHTFDREGDYIGIVTAKHPSNDKVYRAVFPFQAGSRGPSYGLIALIVAGLALLQLRFRIFGFLTDRIKTSW